MILGSTRYSGRSMSGGCFISTTRSEGTNRPGVRTALLPVPRSPEVCQVFCATANPVVALVAQADQGRGVVGVVDGSSPRGVEDDRSRQERRDFLRQIGYKR